MVCRAIDNTRTAHKELDNKAEIADAALANSQADVEKLQGGFNEAAGLVQQKEKELRDAREAAEQKAKQLDVARYGPCMFLFTEFIDLMLVSIFSKLSTYTCAVPI